MASLRADRRQLLATLGVRVRHGPSPGWARIVPRVPDLAWGWARRFPACPGLGVSDEQIAIIRSPVSVTSYDKHSVRRRRSGARPRLNWTQAKPWVPTRSANDEHSMRQARVTSRSTRLAWPRSAKVSLTALPWGAAGASG